MLKIDATSSLVMRAKMGWWDLGYYFPKQNFVKMSPWVYFTRENGNLIPHQDILYSKNFIKPQWVMMRNHLKDWLKLPQLLPKLAYGLSFASLLLFNKKLIPFGLVYQLAVSVDTTSQDTGGTNRSTATIAHTIASNGNYIATMITNDATQTVTSVKWNTNESEGALVSDTASNFVFILGLGTPTTGTHNIDITMTGNGMINASNISFIGASSTVSHTNHAHPGPTATDATVAVTSTNTSYIIGLAVDNIQNSISITKDNASITNIFSLVNNSPFPSNVHGYMPGSASSTTIGWTFGAAGTLPIAAAEIQAGATPDTSGFFNFMPN